jgi:hypothetical protein
MKLEEALCYYLPHKTRVYDSVVKKTKVINMGQGASNNWVGIKTVINYYKNGNFIYQPILRPMSDITKPIEHEGERFVPIEEIHLYHNFSIVHTSDLHKDPTRYPHTMVIKLIEWHFDIFGLIEKEQAVNYNEVTA